MVATSNLSAETRQSVGKGKSRTLRREGRIPAIIYGNKLEPLAISINERDLNAELRKEGFFNRLCDLEVNKESIRVLPQEISLHPVTDKAEHIDFLRSKALLPETKNGCSRWVPLNGKVLHILTKIEPRNNRVFPITDNAFRQAWDRLRKRADIANLTFHDLRHEAISRLFESGLSIPQVMQISGHQTASQLFRYIQLKDF